MKGLHRKPNIIGIPTQLQVMAIKRGFSKMLPEEAVSKPIIIGGKYKY